MNQLELTHRGLRVDGKGWAYGYPVITCTGQAYILEGTDRNVRVCIDALYGEMFSTEYFFEVQPETISRFTGLYDESGILIFMGDLIEWLIGTKTPAPSIAKAVIEYPIIEKTGDTQITHSAFGYRLAGEEANDPYVLCTVVTDKCLVVGNIYENPELILTNS